MSTDETAPEQAETPAAGGKRRTGLVVGVLLLLVGAGAAGAWYLGIPGLSGADPDAPAQPKPPLYFTLDSELVVNFRGGGRVRYLQLGIELMTRDEKALEALATHMPVLRNNLIFLLSDYEHDDLVTREGKEALREAALAEVRAVMEERYGSPAVETLYFTTFVMQ